jgi:hypothetical protein
MEWTYFVQLDGDYAQECASLKSALDVRANARGHIKPEDRKMWREATVYEDIYIPMSDPSDKVNQ